MSLAGFKALPLPVAQLSLAAVLKCGQSFRWSILTRPSTEDIHATNEPESSRVEYRLCLRDRVVCLRQSQDTLFYRSVYADPQPSPKEDAEHEAETLAWLQDYFQLEVDLVALYKEWAQRDPVFASFQIRFEGIRMLRQDPWENLVSFICSSNNNISRITKMIQNLCKQYSPPLLTMTNPFSPEETLAYHPFPPPSALADPVVALQLRSLGFGYRADFIQRTAKMLVDAHGTTSKQQLVEEPEIWLHSLRKHSTSEAREELLKFVGVGRKVADCILLMSLDKKDVVPVDTHVHQIAMKYYGLKGSASAKANMTPKLYEEVNAKLVAIWGEYAGWAHSVLFTADLKSFSTYGLPASEPSFPSPKSISKKKAKPKPGREVDGSLLTPPKTPSRSPSKRSLHSDLTMGDERSPTTAAVAQLCEETEENLSLVDRVKRRRRA
ncbi:DNA glycosylase [Agrocybe pediades]|nr:DNA glycosylase [Agrocybe pediades]